MDTLLAPLMDDLRACVCAALEDTLGGGAVCACTLMPGQDAPADWCACKGRGACGMAWVRLDGLYAAGERFPAQDTTTRGACAAVLAAVLEVGVYRCLPSSGRDGTPPPVEAQTQAALIQSDDALALHRAINCCDAVVKRPHLLGRYTPRSAGDCGGGVWTVTVQLTRR